VGRADAFGVGRLPAGTEYQASFSDREGNEDGSANEPCGLEPWVQRQLVQARLGPRPVVTSQDRLEPKVRLEQAIRREPANFRGALHVTAAGARVVTGPARGLTRRQPDRARQ
jgi:hypothetical protein